MAYDTTYTQSTYALADAAFDYESNNASEPTNDQLFDEPTSNANAPGWQWTDDTSPSSSTGPPASNGGCVFPESSSPMAAGDINMATLKTANEVDASLYLLYVDIDICTYGNTSGNLVVQAFDGSTWNTIHTRAGDSTTTFTSVTDLDCTGYTNDDFSVRVVVNMASTGNVYQCDFAFQNLRIHGADADVTPVITNAGDEDFVLGETNITVTGTDFLTEDSIAVLELGDSATYGSATLVAQSIDTWADTSIQFDLTIGTLDQEQLWLYVTNSDDNVSNAWEVHVEMTPTITNAGDEEFETTETNIVMTGTNFLASQSTGKVELVNNSVYASGTKVTQTSIDSWADGSIQFDLSIGSFTEVDLWLFATNSLGHVSTGYAVEILRTPTITDVEDESLAANEKGVEIDGTYFLDTKGTGKVELSNNSSYGSGTLVTQVTNGWDTDLITFNVTLGTLSLGTNYLFVTNDQGKVSASYTVTIVEAVPETLYQTSSIQASITSAGLDTVIFLIRDE